MSTDYLLTGKIIDKDLLILSNKLRKLTPSQVRCIENIIDECDTLFYTNEQKGTWKLIQMPIRNVSPQNM